MKLQCPDCGSTNIGQYRMLTGAIWCYNCYFTASNKETHNPFIVDNKNEIEVLNKFYKKMNDNMEDMPVDFQKCVDKNF